MVFPSRRGCQLPYQLTLFTMIPSIIQTLPHLIQTGKAIVCKMICSVIAQYGCLFLFPCDRWSPENKSNMNPYAFMPFGMGPRNCVGMRFAMEEIKLTLCTIIKQFRFFPVEETPVGENFIYLFLFPPELTLAYFLLETYFFRKKLNLRTALTLFYSPWMLSLASRFANEVNTY